MKIFLQALGLAVVLFFYGYFLSTAGHDHSAHKDGESHSSMEKSVQPHDDGHDHNYH